MDVDDEHKEHSHYNDANKEDELQSGGNHIDMGNLLTQNQKTAAQASPTSSETLQIQIWLRWQIGAGWRNPLKFQWWSALQRGWKSKATAILQNINEEIPNNKKILS